MNKIVDYLKNYIGVISIVLAVCILLTYSLSYFKVNTESKRAAEMYIGELKYTISIDGTSTNSLTVPSGETIIDIDLTNQNEIKTYYKLLYLNNSNISISYFNQTKNTSDEVTSYKAPSDAVESKSQNSLKLRIMNNSTSNQTLTFKVSGGYSTNTLADVEVPNTYTEITTLETPSTNTYFCKTNDTLTQGLEYVDGQYTYGYKEEGNFSSSGLVWNNISNNGWGVQLTDKTDTSAVTSNLCTYINNKPIVSMKYMFYNSKATTIDFSGFDTSNVTDMLGMFSHAQALTLNLNSFNTSNVTDMSGMFETTQATTIDLSSFDTSNVIDMNGMFYESKATLLDLSKFNTSNVTDMAYMFYDTKATVLDLSNFNTSKVTNMSFMFSYSKATTLNTSSFDTSKVTNMYSMFSGSVATTLDVSNFNTSKVANMSYMFYNIKATKLDLSSFDTSNVGDMSYMFASSSVTTLDLINFDTRNVNNMRNMFWGSDATTIDVSNFNTSNVTNMKGMFGNTLATSLNVSYFNTSKVTDMSQMFYQSQVKMLDLASFDTSSVTDMSSMFQSATSLNKIYVSDKFITSNVSSSSNMFIGVSSLVGGAGTVYDNTKVDKTYAKIDGGTSNPGYFTEAPVPSSFSTDSWETIIYAVRKGDTSKYNVGDTKTVKIGTYGDKTLRISNKSTPDECKNADFSQTACGFVLEFTEMLTRTNGFNRTPSNVGGWPASTIYTTLNTTVYNSFPDELKNIIIDTKAVSGHGSTDDENFVSTDKLYLLSGREVFEESAKAYDTAYDLTRQLDYYKNGGSAVKTRTGTSAGQWWLRTADSTSSNSYSAVNASGIHTSSIITLSSNFAAPAFRIG